MSRLTPQLVRIPNEGHNVYSLCGMQKGIEFNKNSCYVDATLMLLFYAHGHADLELDNTSPLYRHLVPIINSIRKKPFYCPALYTTYFRNCIESRGWLGKIGIGDLMDAEEFIRKIFPHMFNRGFIYYQANVPNFVHCVINYNTVKERADLLSNIFKTSMSKQGLHFITFPHPMLIIKMPYSGGKLVGYDYVVPDLTMLVTTGGNNEQMRMFELTGVMSYRGSHFVAYMRREICEGFKWLYSNSAGENNVSQVINCESMEENLQSIMQDWSKFPSIIQTDLALADLCATSFIAFYAPTSRQSKAPELFAEPPFRTTERSTSISNASYGNGESVTPKFHTFGVFKSPTLASSKILKPAEELTVSIANTPVDSTTTNGLVSSEEKSVTKERIQLFSIAIYAFTDSQSPLERCLHRHFCNDCFSFSSKCLPWLVLSFRNNIQSGEFNKIHDIFNSASMANARINPALLDASEIFKLLLHIGNAPQFLTRSSGNTYQFELPAPEETCVRSIEQKFRHVNINVNHCLIITRKSFHKSGIIPSEEFMISYKICKLYGVICKYGDSYSLYTLQEDSPFSWKQSWKRVITCDDRSGNASLKITKVETEIMGHWPKNNPGPEQEVIMFHSQVWIYTPRW